MNRVIQIKEEMKQLETQLEQLKKELNLLQTNCDHEFKTNNYIQECTKCHLIESLNW
ncbi:serine protease [Bacillus songklensis]|uniref:Serine protease n=1 Tax=Bacillus songklensis TaxID=1069116 RepID=A0ABV8B5U3_9BACI